MVNLPEVNWRKYLAGKHRPRSRATERKLRFDIRKRAQQCMANLTLILGSIPKISDKPEKDFAKIFKDENEYYSLINSLQLTFRESYRVKEKLAAEEHWDILRRLAMEIGLGVHSKRKMFDRDYRLNLMNRLKRKEKRDDKPYTEMLWREVTRAKERKQSGRKRRLVFCPRCKLEQQPDIRISCPKCGFSGPVIGDLYEGF